jgi:sortase A
MQKAVKHTASNLHTWHKLVGAKTILGLMLICSLIFVAKGTYIHAKASLAQILMASAWEQGKQTNIPQKPWPWADTVVIGKIQFLNQSDYILAGESGRNLAFGPSLMSASAPLSALGNSVIIAHRDTHFADVQFLQPGDLIELEYITGARRYEVTDSLVITSTDIGVMAASNEAMLTLITCFPFTSIEANPHLRFALRAVAV